MNSTFDLPDERVAIAGDWHGNRPWARAAIRAITATDPTIRTVLHLGDLWPDRRLLRAIDTACRATGIARVLFTVGNHEPYDWISTLLRASPDGAAKISDYVYILQRPQRLTISNRVFLSLGGAASVDREWREPGRDWWPDERITDAQVEAAIAGGPCDVMLTHESVDDTPVHAVREILSMVGHHPADALDESRESRQQVDRVWDAVRPEVLFHGHMHASGAGTTADGRRVVALGCDDQEMNVVLLDVGTLTHRTVIVSGPAGNGA